MTFDVATTCATDTANGRNTYAGPDKIRRHSEMIHADGSQDYPEGRPDHLWREYPNGERWYYAGRPDHLWWEDPDGERWYYT